MDILNVGHFYHVQGGSDQYMLTLQELLQRYGHEVIPFASAHGHNRPTKWSAYFPAGVDVNRPSMSDMLRFFYSWPARRSMARLLCTVNVDVAHLHVYYGHLTTSILKPLKDAGVPVVQSLHDYKLTCPVYTHISHGHICEMCGGKRFWQALPRRCNRGSLSRTCASVAEAYISRANGDVRYVDHFIAVSDFMRRKMLEHDVVEPERISTVHNFVNVPAFEPATEPGKYLLYFGRIAPVKGLNTLIQAARSLRDTPLYIVGTGPQQAELQTRVAENGWSHIRFLGFQSGEALHDLVRGSICVVVPSEWYENCPMSVLESLALGRPVIGAAIGGIPELINDGEDGLLVPSGNVDILREKLIWMVSHREQAAAMGRRGREKVEQQFSPEVHYRQIMDVYRHVQQRQRTVLPSQS